MTTLSVKTRTNDAENTVNQLVEKKDKSQAQYSSCVRSRKVVHAVIRKIALETGYIPAKVILYKGGNTQRSVMVNLIYKLTDEYTTKRKWFSAKRPLGYAGIEFLDWIAPNKTEKPSGRLLAGARMARTKALKRGDIKALEYWDKIVKERKKALV
jgi:hypothetical protein